MSIARYIEFHSSICELPLPVVGDTILEDGRPGEVIATRFDDTWTEYSWYDEAGNCVKTCHWPPMVAFSEGRH